MLFAKGRRPKKTKKASWQSSCEDLLLPDLGRKGHTERCCGPNNPVKVRFSYSVSLYSFILATGIRMMSHNIPSSNQTVNMQFGKANKDQTVQVFLFYIYFRPGT